jgi:YD repeat-containing protein
MTDQDGVVSQNTETEPEVESSLLSIADIADAAGLDSSIFDNAESDQPEEVVQQEEVEEEIVQEIVQEPEPVEEPEEAPQESDGVKKRIGRLIEARDSAKEEAERYKAELEKLKDAPEKKREQKGLSRFDDINSVKELTDREDDAEHLREWLLANPDGGEYVDASGQEHEVEYDQAKKLIVETDRDLRKNIPQVRQRLLERQRQEEVAKQTFTWMSDAGSVESMELGKILSNNEFLKAYANRDPYAKVVLGYAIEGFKSVQQSKAKPKQTTAVAPQVPSAPSRAKPSVVKPKSDNLKQLFEKAKSGEVNDAASYLEKLL